MKRLLEMLGGKMKKLLTVAALLIASTNANAAFYLITNEGNKVTVSNDLSIAVYINPKTGAERFVRDMTSNDQVDNYGRPYTSVGYYNSKCQKVKRCGERSLGIKMYGDKVGGANIIFFDSDFHVIKTEDVDEKNITKD